MFENVIEKITWITKLITDKGRNRGCAGIKNANIIAEMPIVIIKYGKYLKSLSYIVPTFSYVGITVFASGIVEKVEDNSKYNL